MAGRGEPRAASVAIGLATLGSVPFFLSVALPTRVGVGMLAAVAVAGLLAAVFYLLPIGASHATHGRPDRRVDHGRSLGP